MKNSSTPTFVAVISVILLIHTSVSKASFHFEDEFEDGIINPTDWIIDDPPGGVTLAETGGVLSATAPVIGYFDDAALTLSYTKTLRVDFRIFFMPEFLFEQGFTFVSG